jgi:subtilisin-like proprotein convertase family protein
MKPILSWLLMVALSLATAARADIWSNAFPSGVVVQPTIPDGNPNGNFWEITVSGAPSDFQLTNVAVTLNLSGGYNGDLYAYLSYNDTLSVLLNRPGKTAGNYFGYSDSGMQIKLDDSAANDIHLYRAIGGYSITGGALWQPDGRNVNPATATDADSRTAPLSVFNGLNPNGTWTLFIADLSGGDVSQSTLIGWSLEMIAIPEPSALALSMLGGFAVLAMFRRRSA